MMMCISVPSFILISLRYQEIVSIRDGIFVYWLAVLGITIDMLMFCFYVLTGYSRHFHYYLSRAFNTTKK
ncbi:hypothetical protein Barb6_03728 [Bacteroidales bacterium Barb6]|nr:hypothetical protein Barb6_03728 [Bacteroidales bacterium Barb6]